MKAHILFLPLILVLSGLVNIPLAFGGGEGDHSHGEEPVAANANAERYFSTEVSSEKYELLLRYEPLHPGEQAHLTLFISDFLTNKPINGAEISITAQQDPSLSFSLHQDGNGTYSVETIFPAKQSYSLVVNINGALGADLLLLQHIEVGMELPHDQQDAASSSLVHRDNWFLILIVFIVGVGLGLVFRKRNTVHGKTTLSAILLLIVCSIPFQVTIAHGDDDHGAGQTGNVFSNTVSVPKETQFLFDIYTQKVTKENFKESSQLFGTILPSSNGQAKVTTPQNGILLNVYGQVGKSIRAGQDLAVVEQNIDASAQVNMEAERNNLIAEYEASKKEVDRLESIKDIVSKKDIDEAAARYKKAETNLALFNSKTGRHIVLKAPISGILANFNVSVGSTVTAGQELFTITNLSTLYVEAQVFDKDAEKILPDATYTVECANDNHKTSQIKLLSLAQEINSTNQSQKVLFQIDNPDSDFKIGEFVNVRVFASTASPQITLPNSAITEINGKPVVFQKETAEAYSISYVQLGENNGTHTIIIKGLEENNRAVINGSYQLKMIFLNQ